MAGHAHAKPPKRERTIDGTTYIVTSHFKQAGSTAADHVRRLIDVATKERKKRRKTLKIYTIFLQNSII